MDKHHLCHKCNGDKPWSPVFRSEKPCDTGRCVWNRTEGPEHIPHTQWMKTEHFKDCSSNPHHKLKTRLVNVSTCIKCEQVFPINCDPIHCPQANQNILVIIFHLKITLCNLRIQTHTFYIFMFCVNKNI